TKGRGRWTTGRALGTRNTRTSQPCFTNRSYVVAASHVLLILRICTSRTTHTSYLYLTYYSYFVVQIKLVRRRTQPDRGDLVLALVPDPRLDEIGGEHPALGEEIMIGFEIVEHLVERVGRLRDVVVLLGTQLVQVL